MRGLSHCFLPLLLLARFCSAAPVDVPDDLKQLAASSDAVVVAHAGSVSRSPAKTAGSVALWIDRGLKGRLLGGRHIVWVPGAEFPKPNSSRQWLLFLTQDSDGAWHIDHGPGDRGLLALKSPDASPVPELARHLGVRGAATVPAEFASDEIQLWIKKAGRGSAEARREAFGKLVAAGDAARPELLTAVTCGDSEAAAVARRVLPLTGGGPEVNGLRLKLEPSSIGMKAGDARTLTVRYANLTESDIRVVTGVSDRGRNVEAAAAFAVYPVDLRKLDAQFSPPSKGGDTEGVVAVQTAYPATLPKSYRASADEKGPQPLPIIQVAPDRNTLLLAVQVKLERTQAEGREVYRLSFPYGHVDLPGPGSYGLRVRFDCPGPRADQARLIQDNYWAGGQLVSNQILFFVEADKK